MLDFITAKGGRLTLAETYENAKNQNVVLRYTDVNEAQFETYRNDLLHDFTVYDEKSIVGNRFATLVNDTHELHICFYPSIGEMRVIYGARGWLPEKVAPVAEHIMTPAFTQIGLSIGGMLYVIQLADGTFMIIDSGKKNDDDRELLLNFLLEKKPAQHEKPVVSAWLISHSHHDHLHLCLDFLLSHGDKVELKLFGYNFPDFETDIIKSNKPVETEHALHWQNSIKELLDKHFPTVTRWTMHTGQKLLLPGCEAEFLGTWEDHWPAFMKTVNETSFIVRFTFENGHTFLLPCDAWNGQTDLAVQIWGDHLKSDVLQVIHHGLRGGNIAFYEKVLPEIVFWPSPETRFVAAPGSIVDPETGKKTAVVRDNEPSLWLLERIDRHYHCGRTVTIDTKTLEEI
ncbi:MAG: hypothetical protein IKB41_00040 [Clostridia bacterium]|nr:hypothetical protein [Clostridia bacterium]